MPGGVGQPGMVGEKVERFLAVFMHCVIYGGDFVYLFEGTAFASTQTCMSKYDR